MRVGFLGRASGDTDVPELRHFPACAAAVTSDLEAVFCHGAFAVCCAKPVEPVSLSDRLSAVFKLQSRCSPKTSFSIEYLF